MTLLLFMVVLKKAEKIQPIQECWQLSLGRPVKHQRKMNTKLIRGKWESFFFFYSFFKGKVQIIEFLCLTKKTLLSEQMQELIKCRCETKNSEYVLMALLSK